MAEQKEKSEGWKFLKRQQELQEWIEKVTGKRFQTDDFAKSLSDGTLLCSLMLWLDERSIPKAKIFDKPKNIHHYKDNIFLFVEACRDYGVPRHKLFRDTDLLERKHLIRVVECLEELERIAVSKHNFAIPVERIPEDQVDYAPESVEQADSLIKKDTSVAVTPVKPAAPPVPKTFEQQLTARGVDLPKLIRRVIRIQSIFRGRRAKSEYKKRKRAQAFRDHVAKEILSTEETYVAGLNTLVTYYKKPLQDLSGTKKEIINVDTIKSIFSDVEIILGYNSALLEELRPRLKSWSPSTCLGDIFIKITKFMKVYTSYVKGYDDALNTLQQCRKDNEKFVKFLKSREEEQNVTIANIEMLLILPIQRIPRYNLLLEQLIKHTWDAHPDYQHLVEAYNTMKDVANYVNEKKREFENIAKVREIQNLFVGKAESLISPNRRFVRSDLAAVWTGSNDSDKKQQELLITVFNDIIVVSLPGKKGTLKFKEAIRISNVRIKEPKLRKWATKRATLNKSKEAALGSSSPQTENTRARSESASSNDDRSRSGSLNLGNSLKKEHFSIKHTVELVNSKDESILKVCFDNAITHANWTADFAKVKHELEQIDAQKTERAKKLSEVTKMHIASNLMKSLETKKAGSWRSSLKGNASLTEAEREALQKMANDSQSHPDQ